MPTESRSSNTEQMVSVPRDEVERLVKLLQYQAHPYPSPHAEFWQGLLDAPAAQHQGEPVAVLYADGFVMTKAECGDAFETCCKVETPLYRHPPTSDGFSAEQMTIQGADGYRNGIKAAAELAEAYPELAQAIRALPLPQ
ncbi:hypothetical protein EI533_07000 [Pseudomonas donghuensis]|nr:hypothetical protein [Pseudomonas donghuensis]